MRPPIKHIWYQFPDPLDSDADWAKAQNLDLQDLSDVELYQEEIRTKIVFSNINQVRQFVFVRPGRPIRAEDWLLERLAAIRSERQRRARRSKYG